VLVFVFLIASSGTSSAASNDFRFTKSKSIPFRYNTVVSWFDTRVTGGAVSPVRYRAYFDGSASARWYGTNPYLLHEIQYNNSFRMTGLGGLSVSKSGPSVSISGATASYGRTGKDVRSMITNYSLGFQRINICWVSQSFSTTYVARISGTEVDTTFNISDDRVFW
jgi:hypothetical protein